LQSDGSLGQYNIRLGAKNVFAIGASYEAQIAEATSIKVSLTGEVGQAIQEAYIKSTQKTEDGWKIPDGIGQGSAATKKTLTGENKLKNLKSYGIGVRIDHANFSYSVAYGNLCKSFTSTALDKDNRKTDFYGAAIGYKQDAIGVSIAYIGGNNRGNKFNSVALGSEYTLAPGLVSYAEVAYALGKGKGRVYEKKENLADSTFDMQNQKFSGTSFVLGLKVKF